MANVYKGLTIKLEANSTEFSKALIEAQRIAIGTTKELKTLNSALKIDPRNIKLLAQQQEVLKTKIQSATEELKLLKAAESEIGKENMTSEQWTRLQSDIVKTEQKLDEYKNELKQVEATYLAVKSGATAWGDEAIRQGDKLIEVGEKINNASSKISSFGDSYTQKVSAPIVAGAAAAVAATVSIDDALTNIRKTVDGTEEDYQKLKNAAIEFSKTNAVSAEQILEVEALGGQLGYGVEMLEEFGRVASGLDIATNMDAETAATEMAQFMNITGKTKDEISNYGSTIVDLGNHLATTESKISAMAARLGAAGYDVGMSRAEILGLAGALASMGLEAEGGGSAISTILAQIDKDVKLNSANLEAWAQTAGMSTEKFATAWQENAAGAFESVLVGMAQAKEDGSSLAVILDELGVSSLRQTDAMKRLGNNTTLLSDAISMANTAWEENSALQTEVDNKNSSISSKFEMLKNKVIAVANSVGEPLSDALLDAIDAAEPLIQLIQDGADAFASMDKEQQQQIISAVAAVAALGPLLSMTGRVGQGIGTITSAVGGAKKALGEFSTTIATKGGQIGKLESMAGQAAGKLGSLNAGLVGLGAGLAIAVAAFAINKWQEWRKEVETSEKAAMSFKDMEAQVNSELDKTGDSVDSAASNLSTYRESVYETNEELKSFIEDQAKANQTFMDSLTDFRVDSSLLNDYIATIQQLGNKDLPLTAKEQTELTLAVKGYNDITGDSIEITDTVRGTLSKSTAEIKENTKAWLEQAEITIYQERVMDAMRDRKVAEEELTKANNEFQTAEKNLNDLIADEDNKVWNTLNGNIQSAYSAYETAKENVSGFQEQLVKCDEKIQEGTDHIANLEGQIAYANSATDDWKAKIAELGDETVKRMEDNGYSTDDFIKKLYNAGVSTDQLKKISADNFYEMYQKCGGDMDAIVEKISHVNNTQLEAKDMKVNDSEVDDAKKKVDDLRQESRNPISFLLKVSGDIWNSVKKALGISSYSASSPESPGGLFGPIPLPVNAYGISTISNNKEEIAPYAANNDIYKASQIIPNGNDLQASIASAREIANAFNKSTVSNTTIYNFNVNGAVLNDTREMRETVIKLLTELKRRGEMNRG